MLFLNQQDKGLLCYRGRPLVSYAIAALSPLVQTTLINANRNFEQYRQFGFPVISDQTDSFDGPLAGILTAMIHSDADILLVIPCDAPLISSAPLQKLLTSLVEKQADIAVAFDGERLHPVFLAVHCRLKTSLQNYLASGERKVQTWLAKHNTAVVDLSDSPEVFTNVNTQMDLSALENFLI